MTPKPSDRAPSTVPESDDIIAQKFSVAAERNIKPIQDVLAKYLPSSGRVLEIASGTGQHIVAHGAAFPELMCERARSASCYGALLALRSQGRRFQEAPRVLADLAEGSGDQR